jgi:hypothetical protein
MKTTDTIHIERMNFTVTNIRPNTDKKSEIETQLFDIFKKYAI